MNPYEPQLILEDRGVFTRSEVRRISVSHTLCLALLHLALQCFFHWNGSVSAFWKCMLGSFLGSLLVKVLVNNRGFFRLRNVILPYSAISFAVNTLIDLSNPGSLGGAILLGIFEPMLAIAGYSCVRNESIPKMPRLLLALWLVTIFALGLCLFMPLMQTLGYFYFFTLFVVPVLQIGFSWIAFDQSPFLSTTVFTFSLPLIWVAIRTAMG
jgi:hypothetical protein